MDSKIQLPVTITALLNEVISSWFRLFRKHLVIFHEMFDKIRSWPKSDTQQPRQQVRLTNRPKAAKAMKYWVIKQLVKHFREVQHLGKAIFYDQYFLVRISITNDFDLNLPKK